MIEDYRKFIAGKHKKPKLGGFELQYEHPRLFDHQAKALEFALSRGNAAVFFDTGLGKSGIAACWADEVNRHTGKPVLILTPLAVAAQMQRECRAFGVDAEVVREAGSTAPVQIANYERMDKLRIDTYGGVVLDESSILKSFTGKVRQGLVKAFANTPYRLCTTATPAPNDHMELGNHAEFLGQMTSMEMLCRWFINDTAEASQKWRIKGHAVADFWRWVSTWAISASLPSDVGGDDTGYLLEPYKTITHVVDVDISQEAPEGMLFRLADQSATNLHAEKRHTLTERVRQAADIANNHHGYAIAWCLRNDESAALVKAIPDAVEVKGSMDLDKKEDLLTGFASGEHRVLVSKPQLAGFGLNLQHVDCHIFASLNHSYEQYYQAVRRSWRYGQQKPLTVHNVIAETEQGILRSIRRKMADHDEMKKRMVLHMGESARAQVLRQY